MSEQPLCRAAREPRPGDYVRLRGLSEGTPHRVVDVSSDGSMRLSGRDGIYKASYFVVVDPPDLAA